MIETTPDVVRDEQCRAFNLLEVAVNGGWSLSSVYFDGREGQYKASMRRMIRTPRTVGKRARMMFEHENAYGNTIPPAIISCCQNALDEEGL